MANYFKGESRASHRGFLSSAAQLPPRSPFPPSSVGACPDMVSGLHSHQSICNTGASQIQHQRTPSCSSLAEEQPSWLDELLDDSEVPKKKTSHRRCASDSFTCLESPGSLYRISNIAEEDEFECSSVIAPSLQGFSMADLVDSDQLTVLLEEIQQLQQQQNFPVSVRRQSSGSNFANIKGNTNGAHANRSQDSSVISGNVQGVDTSKDEELSPQHDGGESSCLAAPLDPNVDPKRTKRQSAQRSRVRKLQYIAELERSVNALQSEVSGLSPQVVYLEHQLALLNMNNNALKQQISIYMRDKKLKESQNELLKKEIQRLQMLHQYQLLHEGQKRKQQLHQLHNLQRHSSLPSDFNIQSHHGGQVNLSSQQAKCDVNFSDSLNVLAKSLSGISLGDGSSSETNF